MDNRSIVRRSTNVSEQYLYRYRHLNGKHREWTKKIITESILHFASPSTFNDPFDCRVHYRTSFSVNELKQYYTSLIKKRMTQLNRKERRAKATRDTRAKKPDEFLRQMTNGFQNAIDAVGVLSLSAIADSVLMWSHYAAGHTGLCLKFIATDQTPFFGRALPVNYLATYPEISVISPPGEQINTFLLSKAKDWDYEGEYRIIDHDRGPGEKMFPPEFLVGVILGARMSSRDKETIAGWVSERNHQVELLEATVSAGSFSLNIQPYEG